MNFVCGFDLLVSFMFLSLSFVNSEFHKLLIAFMRLSVNCCLISLLKN